MERWCYGIEQIWGYLPKRKPCLSYTNDVYLYYYEIRIHRNIVLYKTSDAIDKSSGARVIYYFRKNEHQIYMLLIYSKGEQEDLSPEQLEILRKLVRKELK